MDLSQALLFSDGLATLLGLKCHFATGAKRSVNVVYCIVGLTFKILVSVLCLRGVLQHLFSDGLNVTNMVLLASYKFTSVLLFLGVIFFHLKKHAAFVNIYHSLSNEAINLGCFQALFAFLKFYSACVGIIAAIVIWGLFWFQATQLSFGYSIDLAHSALTFYACVYFELKFALVAKTTEFLFKEINLNICAAKNSPKWVAEVFPALRKTHKNLYAATEEANSTFQLLLMLTEILQFQVMIYSGYIFIIDCWDLEDKFTKLKIKILIASAAYWIAIISNYIHLVSACSNSLSTAQETASKLLRVEVETTNDVIREEAALFRTQILHYKHFTFNIFGLVCINKAYVFMVFGALTTYLATLVQFHLLASQFAE
ncbi:uncharacterized protein LOC132194909 [Neocloeon triangulifer]|uniref:uncharacterized protein LOC132194909 n=1 Tax=Neocloeon triangulifer TaxID=2078957 RepID=UPI00286F5521|nr:uncharacterized protein LOC132194909 [Neocloeon triangulifer]